MQCPVCRANAYDPGTERCTVCEKRAVSKVPFPPTPEAMRGAEMVGSSLGIPAEAIQHEVRLPEQVEEGDALLVGVGGEVVATKRAGEGEWQPTVKLAPEPGEVCPTCHERKPKRLSSTERVKEWRKKQ